MTSSLPTRILVTGSEGFIGKNLVTHLIEDKKVSVLRFGRNNALGELRNLVKQSNVIVHLAGENRPEREEAFQEVNVGLTEDLCAICTEENVHVPIIFASSTQADQDNPYGISKRLAENTLLDLQKRNGNPVSILRLPGVFGKWSRPNYNTVVATFCHNLTRGLPISISNREKEVRLAYIDDVVGSMLRTIHGALMGSTLQEEYPVYTATLGELADTLTSFNECRTSLMMQEVGTGFERALYATYISFLPKTAFVYDLVSHEDPRGKFVEMLKTPSCGQFSFFSVTPGVTRGSHYHHSKTEKFLVTHGKARMRFRDLASNDTFELVVSGDTPQVVDSIPGWVHDITNIGDSDALVMLWANENFDPDQPDTFPRAV